MSRRLSKPTVGRASLNFPALVNAVRHVHEQSVSVVSRAVNTSLTLRNWAIGCYIVEYKQNGADRADYGEGMMNRLASELTHRGVPSTDCPRLYAYVALYRAYPQIAEVVPAAWITRLLSGPAAKQRPIFRSLTGKSDAPNLKQYNKMPNSERRPLSGRVLVNGLSYTHLELLSGIEDPEKRTYYERSCIGGKWSVRALKRQMATLHFERSKLSLDKRKLAAVTQEAAQPTDPTLSIRDPYVFEFLGLRPREVLAESELEDALLHNLQDFLLELGHGFCLEARQKSILIGKTRGYVDLVFFHRVLRCHVLVELKVDEFRHEYLGQLNTYVTWYDKHMTAPGDNPPIGLLLCTHKDHALVEYAMAAIDTRLFVSKYQLELPSTRDLERFLEDKHREMSDHGSG